MVSSYCFVVVIFIHILIIKLVVHALKCFFFVKGVNKMFEMSFVSPKSRSFFSMKPKSEILETN
jgi:hypothetical protein